MVYWFSYRPREWKFARKEVITLSGGKYVEGGLGGSSPLIWHDSETLGYGSEILV